MSHFSHLPEPYHFSQPDETLHVLTMYSNPVRYHVRPRLFHEFKARMEKTKHVKLHIVEVAFGERPFEVTDAANPNHLQLRTQDELWHKENALNLLAQRLPSNWKYVAWLDSDIAFDTQVDTWAMEAIHQLQHYKIIQMFEKALDLDIGGNPMHMHKGFVASYRAGLPFTRQYGGWHPGYGWAYTRDAWNGIGGLFDYGILGAGDDHMAKALIGRPVMDSCPTGLHSNYLKLVEIWRDRALTNIKKDIGFLPVTIKHFFHGPKVNRNYWGRWGILKACRENHCLGEKCPKKHSHRDPFDPLLDLKRDWQGLFMLTDRKLYFRDEFREYYRQRREDANFSN